MRQLPILLGAGLCAAFLPACQEGGSIDAYDGGEGAGARRVAGATDATPLAPPEPAVSAVLLDAIASQACKGAVVGTTGALQVSDDNAADYVKMWCPMSLPADPGFTISILDAQVSAAVGVTPILRVDFVDADSKIMSQYDAVFTSKGENGVRGDGAAISSFAKTGEADGIASYSLSLELPRPPAGATQATITFFPAGGLEFQKYDVAAKGAGIVTKIRLTVK